MSATVTQPTGLGTTSCTVGLECNLYFAQLPSGLNSTNQYIYLSEDGLCDESVFPRYNFVYDESGYFYTPSAGFDAYPLNSDRASFTVCWESSIGSANTPEHYVLDGTLAVYGPNSDQLFTCELGRLCELQMRGNLVNESSLVVVDSSASCGTAAMNNALLDLPALYDQPFAGVTTFSLGQTSRSPQTFVYRLCWSSKRWDLVPEDFRVDVGVLEFNGPLKLSHTTTCFLGERTPCTVTLSSPGYLMISESSECTRPAKLRFKLGSGENPVHSTTSSYSFGSIRGADITRDLALCWGSDGDNFPVFVGNFRFSLPDCSTALKAAFGTSNAALTASLLASEVEPLCAISSTSTSLHSVVARGWLDSVETFVDRGSNFDQTDAAGETAVLLGLSSPAASDAFLSAFITKTACDLRIPSASTGLTLVHVAISAGRSAFLLSEILPRLGRASLETPEPLYGATPAIWAAQASDNEALAALLGRGVEAKVEDSRGRTPLHFAAMSGNVEGVQTVLRHCCPVVACLEWRDERNLTPREVAKNEEVKFWLDEYAGDTQGCAKKGL